MGRPLPERYTTCPWHLEPSDLVEQGEPEFARHVYGGERQIGLLVYSSCPCRLVLGLLALRCTKAGDSLIPEMISIAETPIVVPEQPAMNVALLSGGQRRRVWPEPNDPGD